MNENGVLTTIAEMSNPELDVYETPPVNGLYKLRLDHKAWFKKGGLKCYFTDVETDEKICLYAWRREKYIDGVPRNVYRPAKSDVDFSTAELGTLWDCVVSYNSKGTLIWESADPMS